MTIQAFPTDRPKIPAPLGVKPPTLNTWIGQAYGFLLQINGEVVDVTDTEVAADAEFLVTHHLGKVPEEVLVLVKEAQTNAYVAVRPSGTAWTTTTVALECNTANASLRLRVT